MRKEGLVRFGMAGAVFCLVIGSCGPPLTLSPDTLPKGAVGVPYLQSLSSNSYRGTHWTIAEGQLPSGLELSYESGVIIGTPTQAGDFEFTVRATNDGAGLRSGEITYTLTIIDALTLEADLATARVAEAYSDAVEAGGGVPPYTYTSVGLPAGIGLDAATGALSGTPTYTVWAEPIQLAVTDSGDPQQTVHKTVSFTVKPRPVAITTESLPAAEIDSTSYSATLQAENGKPPYTWAIVGGSLSSAGLELVLSTGEIRNRRDAQSGQAQPIPADAATATFTVRVTDSDSPATTADREFTVSVTQPAP